MACLETLGQSTTAPTYHVVTYYIQGQMFGWRHGRNRATNRHITTQLARYQTNSNEYITL